MKSASFRFTLLILTILILLLLYEAGVLDLIIRQILSAVTETEDVLKMISQITG